MFTGIIQSTGTVNSFSKTGDGIKFIIKPSSNDFLNDVKTGDSISINGACMTVESLTKASFSFTTIHESLTKTNLGLLRDGSIVNLEKAMTMSSKLDGHIVQGHVDTTGVVKKINKLKNSTEYFIKFPGRFGKNVIYVGSIAVNGVSLTIAEITKETSKAVTVKIAIIPHTLEVTSFKQLAEKDIVNIEFDLIGKYVQRITGKQ